MFEGIDQTQSIIVAGFILVIYEAIVLMCFYFLAPPVMMILYGILGGFTTTIVPTQYPQEIYTVCDMMFALAFLIPIIWFIIWVVKTESGYQIFGR